ncbi:MAG: methyltransferase domain-containing protein, partial [Deltaproteobacteria bacterium]|nr:methyltransferase domain-containing protein [Deltaproteobacteria bacterium]
LPYDDASFDCVFSSLFFHHLLHEDKTATIGEMFRVLKPCGEFHAADWGKPRNAVMRTLFYTVQLIDGFEYTRENVQGRLPVLFSEGGFTDVRTRREFQTVLGTMTLYSGKKPSHIS